ncbi:cohesin domain-containing protein [Patescibacteria group bacterium]|jgi:hypothetical protein|nr:cohesin domain-containing protein [Patescibacteria group bacterium]
MKRLLLPLFACLLFLGAFANRASAATLSLTLDRNTAAIGDTFQAILRIESEQDSINAAQATLLYPKDLVEATEISVDDSVFSFWLEHPPKSDSSGKFSFIGGSSNGYKGKSLVVWKATFKVKGSGPIELRLTDSAVTANDGNGTNVLIEVRSAFLASVPKTGTYEAQPALVPTSTLPTTSVLFSGPPVQIRRTPVPADNTPRLPQVEVPLYPNPQEWYNAQENFLVRWELPPDISAVATAYDQNPSTVPSKSEGLFDNKILKAPEDGISYLHVRFRNNVGWGPTLHHRIAVDTTPPSSFTAIIEEGSITDSPTPTVTYRSTDAISAISRYVIRVDAQEPIETTAERVQLPIQSPGVRVIRVEAYDQAGNATEDIERVEILALPSPLFADVDNEVYIGEGGLEVDGSGPASSTILLGVKNASGQLIASQETYTDEQGNWRVVFDFPFVKGTYFVEAFTRDERGATSYVARSRSIVVRERPFLILAGVEITQALFFGTIIFLLLVGFAFGWITRSIQRKRRVSRTIVSERDVVSTLGYVLKETEIILKKYKDDSISKHDAFEVKELLLRLKKRVKKAEDYLLRGMDDISK